MIAGAREESRLPPGMRIPWIASSTRGSTSDAGGNGVTIRAQHRVAIARVPVLSPRVWRWARRSPGALGVSLRAQPARATFWTLSAWTDRDALDTFARSEPHHATMRKVRPWIKNPTFRFRTVPAADLVPAPLWDDAEPWTHSGEPRVRT